MFDRIRAWWRRVTTPAFIIYGCESRGDAGIPYMSRYSLFKCRWFKVNLHVFHRSDHDTMHDHPWSFWSLILRGGYFEDTPRGTVWYAPGRLLWRPAKTVHRVRLDESTGQPRPAVTLVFASRRRDPGPLPSLARQATGR